MNFNLNQDVVEELQKRSVFQRSFWSSSTTWRRGPVHLSGTRNDAQTESLDRGETLRNRNGSHQRQGTDHADRAQTSGVGRDHSQMAGAGFRRRQGRREIRKGEQRLAEARKG